MDKELTALRRVAQAAKSYQKMLSEKRNVYLNRHAESKESRTAVLDIGTAEFELAEALNEWYRTQLRAR